MKKKYQLLLLGIGLGIIYGLITRLTFGHAATIASITYLFLVPAILGIIPLVFADDEMLKEYKNYIYIPWITLFSVLITFLLFGLEDILCFFILALPFFLVGTIAGLIYSLYRIHMKRKHDETILFLAFLPFAIIFVEEWNNSPSTVQSVVSIVEIDASRSKIWHNIVEVDSITKTEYKEGLFNYLGIPKPLKSEVDKFDLGGKRIGYFEGGLKFKETISEYSVGKRISFDIEVQKGTVSNAVFERHALTGNYFQFVDATYELSQGKNGTIKLALSSSYKLTSKINFYGKFWADLILKDFQNRLLEVIKRRCQTTV